MAEEDCPAVAAAAWSNWVAFIHSDGTVSRETATAAETQLGGPDLAALFQANSSARGLQLARPAAPAAASGTPAAPTAASGATVVFGGEGTKPDLSPSSGRETKRAPVEGGHRFVHLAASALGVELAGSNGQMYLWPWGQNASIEAHPKATWTLEGDERVAVLVAGHGRTTAVTTKQRVATWLHGANQRRHIVVTCDSGIEDGRRYAVDVHGDDPVGSIKARLVKFHGLDPGSVNVDLRRGSPADLTAAGKLSDDKTVASSGLNDGDQLSLQLSAVDSTVDAAWMHMQWVATEHQLQSFADFTTGDPIVQVVACRANNSFLTASGAWFHWGSSPCAVADVQAAEQDEVALAPSGEKLVGLVSGLCNALKGELAKHNTTWRQAFDAFDVQSNGKVSLEDFQGGLRALKLLEGDSTWGGSEADIVYIHKALDSDADGFLSQKDFKQHFSVPTKKKSSSQPSATQAPTEEEQLQAALALSKAAAPSEAQQLEAAIMQSMEDAGRQKDPEPATEPDAAVVQQLLDMGGGSWSEAGCKRAAVATQNDLERAVEWCFAHAQDADFDKELEGSAQSKGASGGGGVVPDPRVVQEVVEMGGGAWSENGAARAAIAAENNLEAAFEWCLSHAEDADFNDPLPAAVAEPAEPEIAVPSAESQQPCRVQVDGAIGRAICSRETCAGVVIHVLFVRQIDADHEEVMLYSSNATAHRSIGVQLIQNRWIVGPCCMQAVSHPGGATSDAPVQSLAIVNASGVIRYAKVPEGKYTAQVYSEASDLPPVSVLATSMHLVAAHEEVPLFSSASATEQPRAPATTVALVRSTSSDLHQEDKTPIWLLAPEDADAALSGLSKEAQQELLSGIDDYGRTPLVMALSTGKLAVAAVFLKYLGNTLEGVKMLLGVYEPAWCSSLHAAVRATLDLGSGFQPADLTVVQRLAEYASKCAVTMLGLCTESTGTITPLQAAIGELRVNGYEIADAILDAVAQASDLHADTASHWLVASDPANDGNTILHSLALSNESSSGKLLYKVLDIISDAKYCDLLAGSLKVVNSAGLTPLLQACSSGCFDNATMLAKTGLLVNEDAVCKPDTTGRTALHVLAVASGDVPDTLIGMLMSTTLPCAKDNRGRTALYDAIVAGSAGNESVKFALLRHTECVRTLVCGLQQTTTSDDEPSLQKCFTAMALASSLAPLRTLLECIAQDHEGPEDAARVVADFTVEEHFNSLIDTSSVAENSPALTVESPISSTANLLVATAGPAPEPGPEPELEPEPEPEPESQAVQTLALGSGAFGFVECVCQILPTYVQKLLDVQIEQLVGPTGSGIAELLALATTEQDAEKREKAGQILFMYAMLGSTNSREVCEKLPLVAYMLANFVVCPPAERSSIVECVFDSELHHSRIKISDDQLTLTSGNGPVSAVSSESASDGRLTWALKLASQQTCCMVGAVKDDFTGFGSTLEPLGWCVDTAGYGGHHTRLRKNDIIAVLADLDEEYLVIWVNGKQVLRTAIEGSIRLAVTSWNGSQFEIVDDVDVEGLAESLDANASGQSSMGESWGDEVDDYAYGSLSDSEEEDMFFSGYGRGRGRGRGYGWGRGRGGGRYAVPTSGHKKPKKKKKKVKLEVARKRSGTEDSMHFLKFLAAQSPDFAAKVVTEGMNLLPLVADCCTDKENRARFLQLLDSGLCEKSELAMHATWSLIRLGKTWRARENLHTKMRLGAFDLVDVRTHRSAAVVKNTDTEIVVSADDLEREVTFLLNEAQQAGVLPSVVVQKISRSRSKSAKTANPFYEVAAGPENRHLQAYDGGSLYDRCDRWQDVLSNLVSFTQAFPQDWHVKHPLVVDSVFEAFCMSSSPTLGKLRPQLLKLVVDLLSTVAGKQPKEWTIYVRRLLQAHFTAASIDTTGQDDSLSYTAMTQILDSRPETVPPPTSDLIALLADEMAAHTLPTHLSCWILIFVGRDLNNKRMAAMALVDNPDGVVDEMPEGTADPWTLGKASSLPPSAAENEMLKRQGSVPQSYVIIRTVWQFCCMPSVISNKDLFLLGSGVLKEFVQGDQSSMQPIANHAAAVMFDADRLERFLQLLMRPDTNEFVLSSFCQLVELTFPAGSSATDTEIKRKARQCLIEQLLKLVPCHAAGLLHVLLLACDGDQSVRLDSSCTKNILSAMVAPQLNDSATFTWADCWRILQHADMDSMVSDGSLVSCFQVAIQASLNAPGYTATSVSQPFLTFMKHCMQAENSILQQRLKELFVGLILRHTRHILQTADDSVVLLGVLQLMQDTSSGLDAASIAECFKLAIQVARDLSNGLMRSQADATVVVVSLCHFVAGSLTTGDEADCTSMLSQISEAIQWVALYADEESLCADAATCEELRTSMIEVLSAFAEGSHGKTKILLRSILDACGPGSVQISLAPFSHLIASLLSSDDLVTAFALELGGFDYLVSRICARTESCQYSFVNSMMKQQRQLYGAPKPTVSGASGSSGKDAAGLDKNYAPECSLLNSDELPYEFTDNCLINKVVPGGPQSKTVDVKPLASDAGQREISISVRLPAYISVRTITVEVCSMTPAMDAYHPMLPPQKGQHSPVRAVLDMGTRETAVSPVTTLCQSIVKSVAPSGMYHLTAAIPASHRGATVLRVRIPISTDDADTFVRISRIDIIGRDAVQATPAHSIESELSLLAHICSCDAETQSEIFGQWVAQDLHKLLHRLILQLDSSTKLVEKIILSLATHRRGVQPDLVELLLQTKGGNSHASLVAEICCLPSSGTECANMLSAYIFSEIESHVTRTKQKDTVTKILSIEAYIRALTRIDNSRGVTLVTAEHAATLFEWAAGLDSNSSDFDATLSLLCSAAKLTSSDKLLAAICQEECSAQAITARQCALACCASGIPEIMASVLKSGLPGLAMDIVSSVLKDKQASSSELGKAMLALEFLSLLAWDRHAKEVCLRSFLPSMLEVMHERYALPGVAKDDLLEMCVDFLTVAVRDDQTSRQLVCGQLFSFLRSAREMTAFLSRMLSWVFTAGDTVLLCPRAYDTQSLSRNRSVEKAETTQTSPAGPTDGTNCISSVDVSSNSAAAMCLVDGSSTTVWDSYTDETMGGGAGHAHWIALHLTETVRISTVTLTVGHIEDISYRPAHVKVSVGVSDAALTEFAEFSEPDPNHPSSITEIVLQPKESRLATHVKIDILSQCQGGWDCQVNGVKILVVKDMEEAPHHALSPWAASKSPLRFFRRDPVYEVPSSWRLRDLQRLASCEVTTGSVALDSTDTLGVLSDKSSGNVLDVDVSESSAFSTAEAEATDKVPALRAFEDFIQDDGGMAAVVDVAVGFLTSKREAMAASTDTDSMNMTGKWKISSETTRNGRATKLDYEASIKHSNGRLTGSGDKDGLHFVVNGSTTETGTTSSELLIKFVIAFDDGSSDSCSTTVPKESTLQDLSGEVNRIDKRRHKTTGSFSAKRNMSEDSAAVADKWLQWLESVKSWCNVPQFQTYFAQDEVCRDLLFFTLGIVPSMDDLPASAISRPETVLNGAAIMLLRAHGSSQVRRSIVEKGCIDSNLKQLQDAAEVDPRKLLADMTLEPEPEQEPDTGVEPEPATPLQRETSAEEFLSSAKKKTPAKKKGVGYGVDGHDDSSWNVEAKVASEVERTERLADNIGFLAAFLHIPTEDSDENSRWEADDALKQQILGSALLPCLEKLLQCDSLLELGRKTQLYEAVMQLITGLSSHPILSPVLDDIGEDWVPRQQTPIASLLNRMSGLADVYLKCLDSGRGTDGPVLTRQASTESEDTEKLARLIKHAASVVGSRLNRATSVRHVSQSEYNAALSPLMFSYTNMQSGGSYAHHHKKLIQSSAKQPPTSKLVRLAEELADISTSLPCEETNSIFLRVDESRIDTMKALIVGSRGTPYSTGCFEFDIFMEDSYPTGPPKVNLATTGAGQIRFNPNLYACGKVCLSLLGTWRGQATENWNPKISTLLQVLCSIQAIIMSDDVYFNEPGFEHEQGTPSGEKLNVGYANIVRFGCVKFAMLGQLKSPSKGFEDVIRQHFIVQKEHVLAQCEQWLHDALRPASYSGLISDHNHEWASKFASSPTKYRDMLQAEVQELTKTLETLSASNLGTLDATDVAGTAVETAKKRVVVDDVATAVAAEEESAGQDSEAEARAFDVSNKDVMDRMSRVIGALGIDAVQKQTRSSVLVCGLSALGIEIAKNVTLSGVKQLAIWDQSVVTKGDLGNQFFTREADVGKNRAAVSAPRLQELNLYVRVTRSGIDLSSAEGQEALAAFTCVIMTQAADELAVEVNQYCRTHGVHFIMANVLGPFGRTFVDFGSNFVVTDANGEEERTGVIANISNAQAGIVKCVNRHDLDDGDTVEISEVVGMPEIVGRQYTVKVLNQTDFSIGDTSAMQPYASGGTFKQIKQETKIEFSSLKDSLANPKFDELCHVDFMKAHHPRATHCAMCALSRFQQTTSVQMSDSIQISFEQRTSSGSSEPPRPWHEQDAKEMVRLSQAIDKEIWVAQGSVGEYQEPDEAWKAVVELFAHTCSGCFSPLAAYMGGIVAQEALKAISGKFTPLRQWMYVDTAEVVPNNLPIINSDIPSLLDGSVSRDSANAIVLGEELLNAVKEARVFMVGAGAVGCELLKNYAMLGVGSAGNGKIVVTDPDVIENSNLSRQFLFRERHIRQSKSLTAGSAAVAMNPSLHGRLFARQDLVHADTEYIYNDDFFAQTDVVTNALDNVKARLFMDGRCVTTRTPLLEPGTLGPKGHMQVIIPDLTENYAAQEDPDEEQGIPVCTLKMFPEETLHCVEWALSEFKALFEDQPQILENELLKHAPDTSKQAPVSPSEASEPKNLRASLELLAECPRSWEDCVTFGRNSFQKFFHNAPRQLLHVYPTSAVTKDGKPFWTLPKRAPTPLEYDPNDPLCASFVVAAAALRAVEFGIPMPEGAMPGTMPEAAKHAAAALAGECAVEEFVMDDKVAKEIAASVEKEAAAEGEEPEPEPEELEPEPELEAEESVDELNARFVKAAAETGAAVSPQEFEKDEDANGHVDFLHAAANLRARSYGLPAMEWIDVKLKAGRIIPALVTTTALVSGLLCVELVKILGHQRRIGNDTVAKAGWPVERFKSTFLNLAVPNFFQAEPGPPEARAIPVTAGSAEEKKVTVWDRWDVSMEEGRSSSSESKITLAYVINHLQEKHSVTVQDVFYGARPLRGADRTAPLHKVLGQPDGDNSYVDIVVTLATGVEDEPAVAAPRVRVML